MISKYRLETFFRGATQDYTELKKWDTERILCDLDAMGIEYKFKTKPRLNQLIAFYIASLENSFLFYYKMGTGKTKAVLDIMHYKQQQGQAKKGLFIVAGPSAVLDITSQVTTHTDMTGLGLLGNSAQKWEQLEHLKEDIAVISYASFVWLCCDLVELPKKKGKLKKDGARKQVLNIGRIQKLQALFQLVVFDEIFLIQNHASIAFKVCKAFSETVPYRYGLTGTPVGRDRQSLWSQFFLMDRGLTLGWCISAFRDYYFKTKKNYWGGWDHVFIEEKEKHFQKRLLNKSLTYSLEELSIELPPIIRQEIKIVMSPEIRSVYTDILQGAVSDRMEGAELVNSFTKLRQLCGGALKYIASSGEKKIKIFRENAKLEATLDLISQVSPEDKVLVFYEYNASGELLSDALGERKIKCMRLYGGTKDKNIVHSFTTKPQFKVLLLQNKAGATSLNLQCANYVIFYESTVSPVERAQQEARAHRPGQEKTVVFYDMVTLGTVEVKIKDFILEGKTLSANLFF